MANRRMFSKDVVDSDSFVEMPLTAQALYFHLCMNADDDGLIGNSRKVLRSVGAAEEDLETLVNSCFLIRFESGVMAVKHWRLNNYIQNDRYKETIYLTEKEMLTENNKIYAVSESDTDCIQSVSVLDTQYSIGKVSIGEDREGEVSEGESSSAERSSGEGSEGERRVSAAPPRRAPSESFAPPSVEDVKAYCKERGNAVNAENFVDYYGSNGWKVGKNPMCDWKAAVRRWESSEYDSPKERPKPSKSPPSFDLDLIMEHAKNTPLI